MNVLAATALLETYLRAMQELTVLIQTAQRENRDITDDEVKSLKLSNDVLSQTLIQRLGA